MEHTNTPIFGANQTRFNIVYYANQYDSDIITTFGASGGNLKKTNSYDELSDIINNLTVYELDVSILMEVAPTNIEQAFELVEEIKKNWLTRNIVIIFLITEKDPAATARAFEMRISDCYSPGFIFGDVKLRLQFLYTYKILHSKLKNLPEQPLEQYKVPLLKRIFDLSLAITAIIILSPVYLIIAILIKLDSKGPIFYSSKRVGTGYQIFNFYKFRSMRVNADKEVEKFKKDNQYGDSAFFKLQNDPRVTKLGNFLRNSSLDELPQLFNVILGNMSIVGNRPLPLYEAELLTTDEWSMRFLGPAGITGLWQIIKRGKSDMSDRERKKLDNFYTKKFSIWLDLKIVFMTFPALFQKEKV